MIETKEGYEAWFDYIEEMNAGEPSPFKDMAVKMKETIEALRKVATAAKELREAMAYNKGAGETKKRLENAYGALWRTMHTLPDWITEPEHD